MMKRSRGQVMVLACISMLLLALMLMASFTLTNAVHEKIRVQSHADSQAYSLATVEARAFNTVAYYNRGIAAAMVAQMSLHSWMAIVSSDVAMVWAGMTVMTMIAAAEVLLGCYPYNFSHCVCVIKAMFSAFKFYRAARKWANTAKGLESQFNKGMVGLQKMVDSLHRGQNRVLQTAMFEISPASTVLGAIKGENADGASNVATLIGLNKNEFACAVEGSAIDSSCTGGAPASSTAVRSRVIQNTANATRQLFNKTGIQSSFMSHSNFRAVSDPQVPKDALTEGNFQVGFLTRARVGDDTSPASKAGARARNVGAGGLGVATVTRFAHIPIMAFPFDAEIYSGQPSAHTLGLGAFPGRGSAHQGNHNTEPCPGEDCFVNFRSQNDEGNDYNQPTVYAGATQNLRLYANKGGGFSDKAPWEVNSNGEISVEFIKGQPTKVKIVPRGTGVAVAKAKTYFHQMGDWKIAPNLFDPFWRAKLHFFTRDEMRTAAALAGDATAAALLSAGAPVEGEE